MNLWSTIPVQKPNTNTFDLSHGVNLSTKMGYLTPILCEEVLPGEKWMIEPNVLARFAPMVGPMMHEITLYTHFFFVPNRLMWPNWEDFITGGVSGTEEPAWPHYEYDFQALQTSQLADYLGFPIGINTGPTPYTGDVLGSSGRLYEFSAFPFAAYAMIFDNYYRSQDIQGIDQFEPLVDGLNSDFVSRANVIRQRNWHHDTFTSALPFTQRGNEALLPLVGDAPVGWKDGTEDVQYIRKANDGTIDTVGGFLEGDTTGSTGELQIGTNDRMIDINRTNVAFLSEATSTSIIELRRAFKLQEWLELNARAGGRYKEYLMAHWGVNPEDMRLDRPEYLGGHSQTLKISEVVQTSFDGTGQPLGGYAGHGITVGGGDRVGLYAKEYGWIMGIMSIMPVAQYQQGLPKKYFKSDKFDYFTEKFAHIGETPILNKEIIIDNDDPEYTDGIFGYQRNYYDYVDIPSRTSGDMRTSLDFYTCTRKWSGKVTLTNDFLRMDPTQFDNRIFSAGGSADNVYADVYLKIQAQRPIPLFGEPKFP